MQIRLGLPTTTGALPRAARALGAPVMVSTNALARRDAHGRFAGFRRPGAALHGLDAALDSAGFVAMAHYGRYQWDPEEYVREVVGTFPWTWWAAMDVSCEPELAGRTARLRQAETIRLYGECRRAAEADGLPAPMPVLQGWTPDDYERFVDDLALAPWPALVGVGSMCRRPVHGPTGLLPVLERLDHILPPDVRLHLFGIKGSVLTRIARDAGLHGRVAAVDSMAWDVAARRQYPTGRTVERRIAVMREWYGRQVAAANDVDARQLTLGDLNGRRPTAPSAPPIDPLEAEYIELVGGGDIELHRAEEWLAEEQWVRDVRQDRARDILEWRRQLRVGGQVPRDVFARGGRAPFGCGRVTRADRAATPRRRS